MCSCVNENMTAKTQSLRIGYNFYCPRSGGCAKGKRACAVTGVRRSDGAFWSQSPSLRHKHSALPEGQPKRTEWKAAMWVCGGTTHFANWNGSRRLACLSLARWNVSEETSEGAVSKRSQASCVATIDTGSRNALRGAGSVVTDGAGTQTVAYERLVGGGGKVKAERSEAECA